MVEFPENLKYAATHEWVKVDGDIATIGITEHAAEQLGDIVFADLPEVGDSATAGEEIANVESAKAVGEVVSPVSGEVVEINEELDDEPEKINAGAFDAFILKVKMSDPSELDKLLDVTAYKATL
ncbi:MAG: glycine cleavage system protein GcvH [Promethearchaeota archaeon]